MDEFTNCPPLTRKESDSELDNEELSVYKEQNEYDIKRLEQLK